MNEVFSLLDETSNLVKHIRESKVYAEYKRALEEIKLYPELKAEADDFRRENFDTYTRMDGGTVSFEAFHKLELKRQELAKKPIVDEYLKAELALCRLVQEIHERILTSVELE